ncbi:MAG: cell surface protein [Bacteroidia bacterium]|nr:cell surface protein [Bacteroidia bacterium]NND24700.1 cell surface protein [Flavobacteriaceae bacterium]MBT8278798.1 cell surface protein [Bacteroidia bacterium]NNK59042.1 cell surface protein [Flavobacteriaceae bacterium]NNL33764.1 cell surface protein [Flavobacteriaceae bacterium]
MKTKIFKLAFIILIASFASCSETNDKITDQKDYNIYLELEENEALLIARGDHQFWEKKLEKNPDQFPYMMKLAASQSQLFNLTGNIEYLKDAETYLVQANEITNNDNAGYLRSLARNYISQHRFSEALEVLKKAEINGEKLRATQLMLFDTYLELGNIEKAKYYLNATENYKEFDFLIRKSKWSDHHGELNFAIDYLENAMAIAESSNNKQLLQWVYTNIADYYGHDGQIKKSYEHYLKALQLNPSNSYAKKGIAWIVYSYEKNPDEALRILDSTTRRYEAPDYYLLRAEIAEYSNDLKLKYENINQFLQTIQNESYGVMYNAHLANLFAEEYQDYSKSLQLAQLEIDQRPTPLSYDLLAWTYFQKKEFKKALAVAEKHVLNKTFEPIALYHIAEIYKALGDQDNLKKLKPELVESGFELGPLMAQKIQQL